MADLTKKAIFEIRIENGPALRQAEQINKELEDLKRTRAELAKAVRDNQKAEAKLKEEIAASGKASKEQADTLKKLTATREELNRKQTEAKIITRGLSGVSRELENDLSGLTEKGLRFRDKMAEANLTALTSSGILGQLAAQSRSVSQSMTAIVEKTDKAETELSKLNEEYKAGRIAEQQYRQETERLSAEIAQGTAEQKKLQGELDKVKAKSNALEAEVKQLNEAFRAGIIGQEEYRAGLKRLEDQQAGLSSKFDAFVKGQGQELKSTLSGLALQYVGIGAAVYGFVNVLSSATNIVIEYDKALANVSALGGEYKLRIDELGNAARAIGPKFGVGASEALGAVDALAKAGVSASDILGGALEGALTLAASGSLDVGAAAEIASSAMTQFGLAGSDVTHIADLLSAGANKAQGGVADLGAALNQSGIVAANTGVSIEESVGALSAFASAGLLGSDAGTSFKTMLQSLVPRSKEAAKAMEENGIAAYDAQGNFIGLTAFAGKLREGLKDMSQEQQQATLKTIFGSDAVRAATVFYNQGAEGIAEWIEKVNVTGFAAQVAADKQNNLRGDLDKLNAKWGELVLSIEDGSGKISGAFRGIIKVAGDLLGYFAELNREGDILGRIGAGSGRALQAENDLAAYRDAVNGYLSVNKRLAQSEQTDAILGRSQALLRSIIATRGQTVEGLTELQGIYRQRVIESAGDNLKYAQSMVGLVEIEKELAKRKKEAAIASLDSAAAATKEGEVIAGNAPIIEEDDKKKKNVAGSVADLTEKLDDLNKLQAQSTSSEQFAKYQAQIDALKAGIEEITAGAEQLKREQENAAPTTSAFPDGPEPLPEEFGYLQPDAVIAAQIDSYMAGQEELKALYEEEKAAFEDLQQAKIGAVEGFAGALGSLAKQGSGAAKALLVVQKAAAVADVITKTQAGIAAATAATAAVPPIIGAAPNPAYAVAKGIEIATITRLKVQAATSIATILAQAISGFAQGGEIGSPGGLVTSGWGAPIRRSNGDNILARSESGPITLARGEVVLNRSQRQELEDLAGPSVWRRIGIPGFAAGGSVGFSRGTALVNASGPRPSPDQVVNVELLSALRDLASRPVVTSIQDVVDGLDKYAMVTKLTTA